VDSDDDDDVDDDDDDYDYYYYYDSADDDSRFIALCILLPATVSAHSYVSCDGLYATLTIAFHYCNKISGFVFFVAVC
jgi:hypothetical protein